MKNVSNDKPHTLVYDWLTEVWTCKRCAFSTSSLNLIKPGCSPVIPQKALS